MPVAPPRIGDSQLSLGARRGEGGANQPVRRIDGDHGAQEKAERPGVVEREGGGGEDRENHAEGDEPEEPPSECDELSAGEGLPDIGDEGGRQHEGDGFAKADGGGQQRHRNRRQAEADDPLNRPGDQKRRGDDEHGFQFPHGRTV